MSALCLRAWWQLGGCHGCRGVHLPRQLQGGEERHTGDVAGTRASGRTASPSVRGKPGVRRSGSCPSPAGARRRQSRVRRAVQPRCRVPTPVKPQCRVPTPVKPRCRVPMPRTACPWPGPARTSAGSPPCVLAPLARVPQPVLPRVPVPVPQPCRAAHGDEPAGSAPLPSFPSAIPVSRTRSESTSVCR